MSPLNPQRSPLSNRPHTPPLMRPSPLSNNFNSFEGSDQNQQNHEHQPLLTTPTTIEKSLFLNSFFDSDKIASFRHYRALSHNNRVSPTKTINSTFRTKDHDKETDNNFHINLDDKLEKESISCPDLLQFQDDKTLQPYSLIKHMITYIYTYTYI